MLFEVVKIITKIDIAKPMKIEEIVNTSIDKAFKSLNLKHPNKMQKIKGMMKLTITYFSFNVKKYRIQIIKGS